MVATGNIVIRKLTVKTASKQTGTESVTRCNFGQQVIRTDGCDKFLSGNKKSGMNKTQKLVPCSSVDTHFFSADNLKVKLSEPGCHKRGSKGLVDNRTVKRQKIDRNVSLQCSRILKKLMTHPSAWPFIQPVDPVKLNIPDYFSIISKPMDLGTIKTKLGNNLYSSGEEFASDVKLTFSNAMLYNPPHNLVHIMAKDLDSIFKSGWKCLEAKLNCKSRKDEHASVLSGRPKNIDILGKNCHKSPSPCTTLQPSSLMSAMKKQKLREELVRVLKGNLPQQLQAFLKKCGFICRKEEKIEVEIDAFDDKTLWELERVIKNSLDVKAAKVIQNSLDIEAAKVIQNSLDIEAAKVIQNSLDIEAAKVEPTKKKESGWHQSSGNNFHKITDRGTASAPSSANIKPSLDVSKCGSCGSVRCQCRHQNDFARSSSSDISSEKSSEPGHLGSCRTDFQAKATSSQTSKSDPDSDGGISALDEEKIFSSPRLSTVATTAASGEACTPVIEVQLSPKKALRAAMLKSRFADTILKAQEKTLLQHGDKADALKMKQEKERLERMQHEEVARIEAEIKAAETARRQRAEYELKKQRERERKAARLALEKIERSVEIGENLKTLKELEMLCGVGIETRQEMNKGFHFRYALERLGLYLKDDMEDDEME